MATGEHVGVEPEIFEVVFTEGHEADALKILRGHLPPGMREHLRAAPMATAHWTADDIRVQSCYDLKAMALVWTVAAAVYVPARVCVDGADPAY